MQGGESSQSTARQQAGQGVEMPPPCRGAHTNTRARTQLTLQIPIVMDGPGVGGGGAEVLNQRHATAAEKRSISWTSIRS